MTFDAQETSLEGGSPVELYTFQNGGTFTRVTPQAEDYQIGGETFLSLEMSRSNPKLSEERAGVQLQINVPDDFAVAQLFNEIVPDERIALQIDRVHLTDGGLERVVFWEGFIINCRFQGRTAKLIGEPIQALFGRQIPRRTYQAVCNHVLFDANCTVSKASFSDPVSVDSISADGITLVLDSLSTARPADTLFYQGGFVQRSNGDKRTILEYTFATDTVRLLLGFPGLAVGELVTAFAGCNHLVDGDCSASKFNNVPNHGGFPFVPTSNPFNTGLRN